MSVCLCGDAEDVIGNMRAALYNRQVDPVNHAMISLSTTYLHTFHSVSCSCPLPRLQRMGHCRLTERSCCSWESCQHILGEVCSVLHEETRSYIELHVPALYNTSQITQSYSSQSWHQLITIVPMLEQREILHVGKT